MKRAYISSAIAFLMLFAACVKDEFEKPVPNPGLIIPYVKIIPSDGR
jgi:hypothetical protein